MLLRLTADDYYKLKVNGEFVAQGPVPGYYFCYYWNEVDITPWVQPGENCLELDVYYQGLINRVWNSGDLRMAWCAMSSQMEKQSPARTKAGNTLWMNGMFPAVPWATIPVSGGCGLPHPEPPIPQSVGEPFSRLYLFSHAQPVLQWYVQEPKIREQLDSQTVFHDFGQELTGHLILEAEGDPGRVLLSCVGEETEDAPQKTRWQMRCGCDYQETLTLSGGGLPCRTVRL